MAKQLLKLKLKGLDCANCANKIERKINTLNEVNKATVNFSTESLIVDMNEDTVKNDLLKKIKNIVKDIEPDVVVEEQKSGKETIRKSSNDLEFKLTLKGLGCANCANKIETRVNKLEEVKEAVLNFSTSILNVTLKEASSKGAVINVIKKIVNDLEPDVEVIENKSRIKEKEINACCSGDEHGHNHCGCGHEHNEHNHEHCGCGHEHHEHNHEHCDSVHEHDHHDSQEMAEKKSSLLKGKANLMLGSLLYVIALFMDKGQPFIPILFVASYVLIGGDVVYKAFRNILKGDLFDENFLMTVATVGAFAIGEYPEAVAVMLFYQIGELFQGYAVSKSRKSISSLMNIRADYANLLINGVEKKVSPEEVELDDIILIKPGERVPLDGVIIEGTSSLDTSALTGESVPRTVNKDDEILSGTINLSGVIKVKVTKEFAESTVTRILELVQNAGSKKASTEKFITKFARYYTPIVVGLAVILAVIPPIVIKDAVFSEWLYRALIFLVVSCPCALVISVPLALFAGIGGASKKGLLIKGGNYLEALKDVDTVVFDKTGTLTKGVFKVTKVSAVNIEEKELLRIAAFGESFSNHPIARSIIKAFDGEIDKELVSNYEEISGNGIRVNIEGKSVLLGNIKLMNKFNIKYTEAKEIGTIIHIAIDNEYKGYIVIADEIKNDSLKALEKLKRVGVDRTVMLTGDNKGTAEGVAKELGITTVYSELLPDDKVEKIEEVLSTQKENKKVIFVGDGINDAPVLARADIGVAMGGIGSDAAIEAADVVLMRDELTALSEGINIAKHTNSILWQNIIFSLGIKIVVLILSALGIANMWEGVFADVGVTLIAVLNSMRALKIK